MAKSFWDTEKTIATLPKNDRGEEIHVKKVTKGKKEYIDVRAFYPKDNELLPGKGIAIPIDLADEIALKIMEGTKEES